MSDTLIFTRSGRHKMPSGFNFFPLLWVRLDIFLYIYSSQVFPLLWNAYALYSVFLCSSCLWIPVNILLLVICIREIPFQFMVLWPVLASSALLFHSYHVITDSSPLSTLAYLIVLFIVSFDEQKFQILVWSNVAIFSLPMVTLDLTQETIFLFQIVRISTAL